MLNKIEKEKLVINLAEDGKNTRDIARIAHVSLQEIGRIIRKHTGDSDQEHNEKKSLTVESQSLMMFKEGKCNVEVAISLNLPAAKVISLYQDYIKLSNLDKLTNIYHDLGKDLKYFIELYERMKIEGLLTTKDILDLVGAQVRLKNLDRNIYELYDELGSFNFSFLRTVLDIKLGLFS